MFYGHANKAQVLLLLLIILMESSNAAFLRSFVHARDLSMVSISSVLGVESGFILNARICQRKIFRKRKMHQYTAKDARKANSLATLYE